MAKLKVIDFPVFAHPSNIELQTHDATGQYASRRTEVESEFEEGLSALETAIDEGFRVVFDKHEYRTPYETRMRYILMNQDDAYEYDAAIYSIQLANQVLDSVSYTADGWQLISTRETDTEIKLIFRRSRLERRY